MNYDVRDQSFCLPMKTGSKGREFRLRMNNLT